MTNSTMSTMFSSKTDLWATPQDLFDELNNEFHFDIDVCADESNHKCDKYYSKEQDGNRCGRARSGATLLMAEKSVNG